jgi:preprotein translocase subunit SecG
LAGAFGGAGGSSAFGSKTGDVFTWITVVIATAFLIVCVIGGFVFQPESVAQPVAPAVTTETVPLTAPPTGTTTTTVPVTVPPSDAPAATPPAGESKEATPPAAGDVDAGTDQPEGDTPGEPGVDTAGGSGGDQ